MPRTGEDFFNRLSSFLCDTLYVSAASDEQRCGHIRPTHKKSLQTLNGLGGQHYFLFGRDRAAHQSTVFLFGGLCCQIYWWKKSRWSMWVSSQVHRLCVLASGTSAFVIFSCFAFIKVCLWHLGQNSGKFFSSVSSRICTLVLLPQTGHSINSAFIVFGWCCNWKFILVYPLFPHGSFQCFRTLHRCRKALSCVCAWASFHHKAE